ncbi:MAG: FKBP-type peptidyl-prolyl cis-trans isomerase [Crocinitomicaceae bacterium]
MVLQNPTLQQVGETGIYIETIEQGTGGKPTSESDIEAHYILTNATGDTLENSYENGSSLKINLTQVIAGWREGFPALEKGGKYHLFVPWEKAYKNGRPGSPQGALCFYIEFIDFGAKGTLTNNPGVTIGRREH